MSISKFLRLAITLAAFLMVAVSPALAQGKGKAKGKDKKAQERSAVQQPQRERPTLQLRPASSASAQRNQGASAALRPSSSERDDRYESRSDDRYESRSDDRYENRSNDRYENRSDDGYGIWDVLGGNDRTPRRDVPRGWCQGRGNPHNTPENCGYSSNDRRYDDDDYDDDRRYSSYAEAHTDFHRRLDREYAARAAQRRSDPIWQIRVRAEKSAEHQRWHEQMGRRH